MGRNLFVYGTLMSSARHPMGQRLLRESRLIGLGVIEGQLFDLGDYPGLIEGGPGGGLVHGEVHELIQPAATLAWLDAYEDIVPGCKSASEYERVERRIQLAAGGEVTAWVYIYRASVAGARLIESGRWRDIGR